jgi:hypothetical protein
MLCSLASDGSIKNNTQKAYNILFLSTGIDLYFELTNIKLSGSAVLNLSTFEVGKF